MNPEFLIVGIARGNEDDFREYYKQTSCGVYALALAYLKDRFLAKEASIESYRRVKEKAYKFDTDLSAEFWHLDLLKNICLNGMCDGEISKRSSMERRDNVAILLSKALFETDQDRGKIIAARCGSGLSKAQVANLLWYQQASCTAEFPRGLKQAAELSDLSFDKTEDIAEQIKKDIKEACPDYFDNILDDETKTIFSNISDSDLYIQEGDKALPGESMESRSLRIAEKKKQRKKKTMFVSSVVIASLLIIAGVVSSIFIIKGLKTIESGEDTYEIVEPQYRTTVSTIIYGDKLYYGNYKDGGKLYVYDLNANESKKISDAVPMDFSKGDSYIYFRNTENGRINVLDVYTETVTSLEVKGGLPIPTEDGLVYSSTGGVSLLVNGEEPTEIFHDTSAKAFRYDMAVTSDGSIVFSAAPTDGLYRITKDTDGSYYYDTTFTGIVIYDFDIMNDYLFYEDGNGRLYGINIGTEGKSVAQLNGKLSSGAFCSYDNNIYYYGTAGVDGETGIYCISFSDFIDEKEPTLLFKVSTGKNSVSDLYVDGDCILVYLSNGSKNKSYNELSLYKLNSSDIEKSKKTVFVNK